MTPRTYHLSSAWMAVVLDVCDLRRVHRRDVMSNCRMPRVVACRHHIWAVFQNKFNASYAKIAWRFGEYDHTTIMSGIKKHYAGRPTCGRPKAKVWSREELALVRERFEAKDSDEQIAAALLATTGRNVGSSAISIRRAKLGLRRPATGGFPPRSAKQRNNHDADQSSTYGGVGACERLSPHP